VEELERELRDLFLKTEPAWLDGVDPRAQRIYRRQVRRALKGGVLPALPISVGLLGEARMQALLNLWLEGSVSETRFYWRLPLEFAAWLAQQDLGALVLEGEPAHPALAELVTWEAVEVEILQSPDSQPDPQRVAEPDPARALVLAPSARLCVFRYPVQELKEGATEWPAPREPASFVLAFRANERLRWHNLHPRTAQLLAFSGQTETLGQALGGLGGLYADLDVEQELERLRPLVASGAILGFV
jgi:hypothetical protein